MSEAGAAGEAGAEEYDDDVFVPHYGNYVHAATPTRNGHQPQQGSFFMALSTFLTNFDQTCAEVGFLRIFR
jgi:hypothetical protein